MDFVSRRKPFRVPNKPEYVRKRRPAFSRETQGVEPLKASKPSVYKKCIGAFVPTNNKQVVAKLARQHNIPMHTIRVELRVGRHYAIKMVFCGRSDIIDAFIADLNKRKLILTTFNVSEKAGVKQPDLYRDRSVRKRP